MSGAVAVAAGDVSLLLEYDAFVDAVEADLGRAGEGDRVDVGLYLLEPGASSRRVLAALDAAAARGARVDLTLDWSLASRLSRLVERTGSLADDALALARARPDRVRARLRREPDHGKRVVVLRGDGTSTSILGGMNLGDRFRPWRDIGVRIASDAFARAVLAGVHDEASSGASGVTSGASGVTSGASGVTSGASGPVDLDRDGATVVLNAPARGRLDVRPTFEALFAREELLRFQVAMAYVDRAGAALLRLALDRGAKVELVLPSKANVYDAANRRALGHLFGARGPLEVRAHPEMLHAKAVVAHDAQGPRVALVGSANLKRNSLRLLAELGVLLAQRAAAAALSRAIAGLGAEAAPVLAPPRYNPLRAAIEERLG